MARTRTQAQTVAYGTALTLSTGTESFEVSFLSGGALVAGTVEITSAGGTAVEVPIAAGQTYWSAVQKGTATRWSLRIKAAVGTPTGQLMES